MNEFLHKLARSEDEKIFMARISELTHKAVHGRFGRSDFLDLRQQDLAQAVAVQEKDLAYFLDGGFADAERKRIVVYSDWQTPPDAEIAVIKIAARQIHDQYPGHRDYLGALLNLGLRREKLGDIAVQKSDAYLMADLNLADFICQQLTRVKNSAVACEIVPREQFVYEPAELQYKTATLASLRLDAAIAATFNIARSEVVLLIENGHVKVNQLQTSKCSASLKPGDLVSIRGLGRFRLEDLGGVSRKGRQHVRIARW